MVIIVFLGEYKKLYIKYEAQGEFWSMMRCGFVSNLHQPHITTEVHASNHVPLIATNLTQILGHIS